MTTKRPNGMKPSRGRQDDAPADLAKMSANSDFFAMRKSGFSDVGKSIMFDGSYKKGTSLAESNNMDAYTAPGDGKYKFQFRGQSGEANTEVSFRMNNDIGEIFIFHRSS